LPKEIQNIYEDILDLILYLYFLNILGYYFYRLEGLGLSFSALLFDSFFWLKIITKKKDMGLF
jgi:hypothetical protein